MFTLVNGRQKQGRRFPIPAPGFRAINRVGSSPLTLLSPHLPLPEVRLIEAGAHSRIIAAGLRGAGETVSDEEVARMPVPGGAADYVRIAVALIEATFGGAQAA